MGGWTSVFWLMQWIPRLLTSLSYRVLPWLVPAVSCVAQRREELFHVPVRWDYVQRWGPGPEDGGALYLRRARSLLDQTEGRA